MLYLVCKDMDFVTEVLEQLVKDIKPRVSREQWDDIQLSANMYINQNDKDWWLHVKNRMASTFGTTIEHINDEIEKKCQLLETMKYIQLGNPESVVVINRSYKAELDAVREKMRVASIGDETGVGIA
jgi:hypothetical protein